MVSRPPRGRRRQPPARSSESARTKPKSTARRKPAPAAATAGIGARDGGRSEQRVQAIVGVGASAGGLEAFSQLLRALEHDTGMAFVFVQHLAPKHESFLPELLAAQTKLPVVQVADGMPLFADHVYVIPPNTHLRILEGRLRLAPRPEGPSQYTPIDAFLRSLAEWGDGSAIGVVLSGSASDGAAGLRAIKAAGGITIAQDPATAKHDGMPRAAIATGAVDLVLEPAAIAAELERISRHPYARPAAPADARAAAGEAAPPEIPLQRIHQLLRRHSGVDFAQYKPSTIHRRLQRRMALQRVATVEQYAGHLEKHPDELKALQEDLLIHVTSFFRDPESFAALRAHVIGRLIEGRQEDPIRCWVPACSTGEEPYSLAISLLELLEERSLPIPVHIFATDVSETAIEKARAGLYPEAIAADLSPERVRRFFTHSGAALRVNKAVRDCCIFARHDATRDPPFSRVDLVLCRNLLIYLGPPLQRKLMQVFHYALKPGGFLMLGAAETVGAQADLFSVADKSHRIYARRTGTSRPAVAAPPASAEPARAGPDAARARVRPRAGLGVQHEATQVLLARYAPPGVVVDDELRIVQFRGQTGAFLEPASGEASLLLPRMLREGLLGGTRAALNEARRTNAVARRSGLTLTRDGERRRVDVVVVPLTTNREERHFAVLFEEAGGRRARRERPAGRSAAAPITGARKAGVVERLRQELAASREYLEAINQDLEAANEELQSANEEILSNNEELQSANEELDTAREEMQSTNEELNTVNDELRGRNEELSRLNSDLVNLLASVQIAIVIVGPDLRIRRFTPMAEKVLNLIPADVGRPLSDIKPNVDHVDLEGLIREVIDSVTTRECLVKDRDGHCYSLRARPYKDLDQRIDGAVLALVDIDSEMKDRQRLKEALDLADGVIESFREPLIVLDGELKIERANRSFCRIFGVSRDDAVGRRFEDLSQGRWDAEGLRRQLEEIVPRGSQFESIPVRYQFPGLDDREILINVRRVERGDGDAAYLLLAFDGWR